MAGARDLAVALAEKFLREGRYVSAAFPLQQRAAEGIAPAVTQQVDIPEEAGFEGLSIQSIGYAGDDDVGEVFIYVTKGSKKAFDALPDDVDGIPINVERMGKLYVRPEAAISATHAGHVFQRAGRIACGSSCAPAGEQYSGTLGAIVLDAAAQRYLLSNNHVFSACNHIPVDMPIMSPSGPDARPGVRAPTEIGRHARIVELRSGDPFLVQAVREDAALAKVIDPNLVSSWQGDATTGYDTPTVAAAPVAGQQVKKIGRTTAFTSGTVEALIPTPTPIPYKARHFNATVWVSDVWTVKALGGGVFALPGDSGSLVILDDETAAIGLLFAASPNGEYGWVAPIDRVLQQLGGLTLVNGHGV
ncbi:MAG: hypothetical protein J5J06_13660 [Phycisphaerae bacterium]|nr:hypothetical protein [Phycisphaerae bacterium]